MNMYYAVPAGDSSWMIKRDVLESVPMGPYGEHEAKAIASTMNRRLAEESPKARTVTQRLDDIEARLEGIAADFVAKAEAHALDAHVEELGARIEELEGHIGWLRKDRP